MLKKATEKGYNPFPFHAMYRSVHSLLNNSPTEPSTWEDLCEFQASQYYIVLNKYIKSPSKRDSVQHSVPQGQLVARTLRIVHSIGCQILERIIRSHDDFQQKTAQKRLSNCLGDHFEPAEIKVHVIGTISALYHQ